MGDVEVILRHIEKGVENECVDFKQEYYLKEKRADLIKDICAFANCESMEDKFIIFGVKNQTCEICGILESLEDISAINQLLEENVEPFINIYVDGFNNKGKVIGYIKIYNNNNRPYVIKREYGNGRVLKKGDIYIRKGATGFRALRSDLDRMYKNKYRKQVSIYDNYLFVGCVNNNGNYPFEIGNIQVLFINETDMPIIFKWAYVTIENQFGKIDKMIFNVDRISKLDEKPYELKSKMQKVENFFFDFESNDCIRLNFDEDGNMNYQTKAKVTFIDLDEYEYSCEFIDVQVSVRGDMLHKIKRKFESFRMFLKNEYTDLTRYIVENDKEKLYKLLNEGNSYFELVQPPYYMKNGQFTEYQSIYDLIRCALQKDEKLVDLFQQQGLSKDFIDSCRVCKED